MKETSVAETEESAQGAGAESALPPKQELVLQAVISHPTLKEAAAAAGISETTLWRYMREEGFSRRLREARREAFDHAATRLQRASGDAVGVLSELMRKEDTQAAARISAARTILEYSSRAAEQGELRARVEELEQFILRKQEEDALDRGREAAGGGDKGEDDG